MIPIEPFYRVGAHFAVDLPGARAMFTTRRGGSSRGPYESLNLGVLTGDDPAAVKRNRAALEAEIGGALSWVRQVHGASVHEVDGASAARSRRATPDELVPADGQLTRTRGIAVAALTADCLPIAVAGDGAVAMLHAGWRGLEAGVIAAGVRGLRRLGVAGPLGAAIGPGAGGCCYDVGPEVHDAFAARGLPDHVHDGSRLDLKAIAGSLLERAGVGSTHDLALCTICSDRTLLFSHRREQGVTGRQGGLAWLT